MRNETLCLWGLQPYPIHPEPAVHDESDRQLNTGQSCGCGFFAVEVCWVSDGAVICRTLRIRASDEARATRLACQCARERLGERFTRIEAVDIEQLQQGDGHE